MTNGDDPGNGFCNEQCTLREAIDAANTTANSAIYFNIPNCVVVCTITLQTALPAISQNGITIDGQTQPEFQISGVPEIEIDGSLTPAMADGLRITGDGAFVRGLVINSFTARGIYLDGSNGSVIQGNYVGTDDTGTMDEGNAFSGVAMYNGSIGNTIGGDEPSERNVLSGNNSPGVLASGNSNNNVITGNYIGTDVTGTIAIGNVYGVQFQSSTGNEVGGSSAGEGNVISGNFGGGIVTNFSGDSVAIKGNLIGLNAAGTAAVPNTGVGLELTSDFHTVGGTEPGARNVISGNGSTGVYSFAQGLTVQGNYIGTDFTGINAIPNGQGGILVSSDATNSIIGGASPEARNVVSGNQNNGIDLSGDATGTTVQGNYIGVAADGITPLGNGQRGLTYSASGNDRIGGDGPGEGNLIANHPGIGMIIVGDPGFPVAGNTVMNNGSTGVDIEGPVFFENNVVTGNGQELSQAGINEPGRTAGVYIGPNSTNAVLRGNAIGDSTGNGVYIDGLGAFIGGTSPGEANVIFSNGAAGVFIAENGGLKDADSQDNTISGNSIVNNGTLGIDIHPQGHFDQDPGDPDQGANRRQNEPVLISAGTGSLIVSGSLNSNPNTDFSVEFFSNTRCDSSGYGEGQNYLASLMLHTDANGNAGIEVDFAMDAPSGFLTSTATNLATGDTSEFSNCVVIDPSMPTPVPTGTATPTATPTPTATGGATATPTPTSTGGPTPTPTGGPKGNGKWGDNDCNGVVDAVDALKTLRDVAALVYTQTEPCPDLGDEVPVLAAGTNRVWGDVDCDGDVDAVDALGVLRFVAALSVNQQPGCPEMGADVTIGP